MNGERTKGYPVNLTVIQLLSSYGSYPTTILQNIRFSTNCFCFCTISILQIWCIRTAGGVETNEDGYIADETGIDFAILQFFGVEGYVYSGEIYVIWYMNAVYIINIIYIVYDILNILQMRRGLILQFCNCGVICGRWKIP